MVDDRDHEGRPRRAQAPRPRARAQRVRRLRRGGRDVVGDGLHRGALGAPPAAVLPGDRHRRGRSPALGALRQGDAGVRAPRSRDHSAGDELARPVARPHLLRDDHRQREPVRRVSGRPGQQPQRRDVLGHLPVVLRRSRVGSREHRAHQGGLSHRVGTPPGRHRSALRSLRAQGPHRRRHDRSGGRDLADRPRAGVSRLAAGRGAAGDGHRHGVPDAPGRHHGSCPSDVAGQQPRRLSLLAGPRVCGGRPSLGCCRRPRRIRRRHPPGRGD